MTTFQWILLDLVVALLGVAAWFGAGATAALGRSRLAIGFLTAALVGLLARVVTVAMLADRGWWFVQEKVLLGLPLLVMTALTAAVLAGRPLVETRRTRGGTLPASAVVSLLMAAYAALAGLMVTLVVGYPLTWDVALITIAVVGVATLLTSRVVTANAETAPEVAVGNADAQGELATTGGVSRRRFLSVAGGAVVVGAGGAGAGMAFLPHEDVSTGGGPGPAVGSGGAVSVADLRGASTAARGGVTRAHVLTARGATVGFGSGLEIEGWTYNEQVPGPAIAATEGDLLEVTLRNTDIDGGVTVHWHGYDIACGEDGAPGVTQDVVLPGDEFVYRFRADQVGTYWYHTHQASHIGVRRGLYGTLVVHPRDPQPSDSGTGQREKPLDLTLPVHTFDGSIVVAGTHGRQEHHAPTGTAVRLRLINTDSDPHAFALSGTRFQVAAVDGRDLNEPDTVEQVRLRLPAGGRYDLVFEMPDTPVALVIDNDTDGGVRLYANAADEPAEADLADTGNWPELDLLSYGQPATVTFEAGEGDRHFTLVLDRGVAIVDGRPTYAHTVNGRGHPSIPDQLVSEGDIVTFTVVNRSLETHPWHLHGHPVLILSRNGTPAAGSPLWVDTFDVRPGDVWEVAFEAANPGIWMNHCHNLPHAHQGMMLRLRYDGIMTPFADAHASHAH